MAARALREAMSGDPDGFSLPHYFPVRVYYEDTDFSGVVYHASYLRFLERGRTEYLRKHGIHQGAIFAGGAGEVFGFAVANMSIDFVRPAQMDDELSIETVLLKLRGASIDMTQRVLREGEVLVRAKVRIAVVADGRATRIPELVLARLKGISEPI
jgi:acyl-CoA thioester hydrolase